MGFSLKKLVKGAVADVNVFDGGKSHANMSGAPRPASTARPGGVAGFARGVGQTINRDITRPVMHIPAAIDQSAIHSSFGRGAQAVGLGALQAGVEGVQGVAGLGDAINHKLGTYQSTSPFTRAVTHTAQNVDATAKAEHSNPLLYHGTQVGVNVGSFGLGGGATKLAASIPKVGRAVDAAGMVAGKAEQGANALTKGLREGNFAQRVAGNTVKNVLNPKYQAANAAFTGLQSGQDIANGRKVTPLGVTTNLVAGGVGFPAAGALGHEVAAPVVKAGVKELRNFGAIAPSRLNPDELAHLSTFNQQARSGALNDPAIYDRGVAAAQKAGIDYRDPKAIDDLLGAHRTFETAKAVKQMDRQKAAVAAEGNPSGGYIARPGKTGGDGVVNGKAMSIDKAPNFLDKARAERDTLQKKLVAIANANENKSAAEKAKLTAQHQPSVDRLSLLNQAITDNQHGPISINGQKPADYYAGQLGYNKPTSPKSPVSIEPKKPTSFQKNLQDTGLAPKLKTGVSDKQLSDIEQARKSMVNSLADEHRADHNASIRNVRKEVMQAGGISKSDVHEDLPAHVKRQTGVALDDVGKTLGLSEDQLIEALNNPTKPLGRAESRALIEEQLASGKHPYSADYKQIMDAKAQRQAELSQYPNGKYRQVKVSNKAPQMTPEELASLSQTPEGMAKKVGNKVVVPTKNTVRNADADRAVQAALKKGATSDEVINTYMNKTGADLQTAVRDVRRVAQESQLGFEGGKNPLAGSVKLPTVQEGDHAQAFLNADYVKQHEQAVGQKALDSFNGLSDKDKTLLQNIEKDTVPNVAKKAENPAAFTEAEKNIRTYYDTRHAYDKALGIDVGYRQNYLRQLFTKAEEEAKANAPEQAMVSNGNKNPGYKQHRTFDTLHTHVGTALERDIHGASSNHAKLTYAKGLEEAYPGKINTSGQMVRGDEGNYRQLTNRYGDAIFADKHIAEKINSRSYVDTQNKFLQKYDKANAGLKYVKLGGGAFHAVTEAGNFIGQQITSGKIVTDPKASAKVLQTFFSPKVMDKAVNEFRDNGTLDKAALSGLKIMAKDILADADIKLGGKISKYSGIQALHDATFQREIPYAKLKMFEQKTKGLDVHNPADLAEMRSHAHGINDLFGGINRDIQGIRPKEFKVLQRFVLATDFTEGKIKTALRAINLADTSPAATVARQAVLGKALLFTALAAGGGAVAGDYKGKSPKDIALDIGSKIADPKFHAGDYSVALPSTHISEFARPVTPLFKGKTNAGKTATPADRLKGVQKYATNRFAAIPSEGLQLVTNKDANGNRIYGKDYKFNGGENISAKKSGFNIAAGFTPIPVSQGIGVGTGRVNVPAAVANVAGLRVSNEKLYNQDATPVQISTGDTPVTLPKDKAIAYNKAVLDQQTALDKKLQASDQYKSASPTDQAAMKKKLHGYITDWQQRSFASASNIPVNKTASASVDAVSNNTLPDNLAKGAAANSKTALFKSPDAEYKQLQKAYDQKIKSGGYLDAAQKIKADKELAKAKVGSTFDKSVRDLYNSQLSKGDVYDYVHSDPNGKSIVNNLLAYGDALVKAGVTDKNKFKNKYGAVTLESKSTTTGRKKAKAGRKARTASNTKFAAALKASNTATKNNQTALQNLVKNAKVHSKTGGSSKLKVARATLKKQSVKTNRVKAVA